MDYFSADYQAARSAFCAAAEACGAWTDRWTLAGSGAAGEPLSVEVAWLGERSAKRLLLHCCGLHGVEGFAGSAVQLRLLAEPPPLGPDVALVLIHVLNPFGMSWLRRANGENVDLNRNFIFSSRQRQATTPIYRSLDRLLNPACPPGFDLFYLQALGAVLRYGYRPIKAAVACGQDTFPRGLFYTGESLQQEVLAYHDWLAALSRPQRLLVIDIHTGLGRCGKQSLLHNLVSTPTKLLGERLLLPLLSAEEQDQLIGYQVRGAHHEIYRQLFPDCAVDFITQEFGTRPVWTVMQALRRENQWYQHGHGALEHPAKRRLKDAFCPSLPDWQAQILSAGVGLVERALGILAEER